MENLKFVADNNVGKLARWLRLMGYDTTLFRGPDDGQMVRSALAEERIILTRDTQILKRRLISSGRLKAILLTDDDPRHQLRIIISQFGLDCRHHPFTLCLECNLPLETRTLDEVRGIVPPYVLKTQNQYMQCPQCQRIFWRGTHWEAMSRELAALQEFAS